MSKLMSGIPAGSVKGLIPMGKIALDELADGLLAKEAPKDSQCSPYH